MRITTTGKIIDNFHVLGHSAAPVYLMDGPAPVLFDAGFTALGSRYVTEIGKVLDQRRPAFLLLTHSHWDHIGAAARFKAHWPNLHIGASRKLRDTLARTTVVGQIRDLNLAAYPELLSWGVEDLYSGDFEPFTVDDVLEPGQVISVAPGKDIQVLGTPGHTWDFLSYWIPEMKILVASESAGCDGVSEFLVDYDAYRESLEKIMSLDVEVLCTGHNLVLTGVDVRSYLQESLRHAAQYVKMVERLLGEEHGDVNRVAERVKREEWEGKPLPRQPEKAYILNTRIRVRTILKRMQGQPSTGHGYS